MMQVKRWISANEDDKLKTMECIEKHEKYEEKDCSEI